MKCSSFVAVYFTILLSYLSLSSRCPADQKPDVMYADIGGMDIQKQEVREAVELPLTHFELYKQVLARMRACVCYFI